jgi:2,3-bisphosphoglycerate-independent phosphoglycerate mutase
MRDPNTGEPHTAHTLLQVPIIAVNAGDVRLKNGRLSDVTPTLLDLLGVAQPPQMTGRSLVEAQYGIQETGLSR